MRTWRRSVALAQQKSRVLPRSGEVKDGVEGVPETWEEIEMQLRTGFVLLVSRAMGSL